MKEFIRGDCKVSRLTILGKNLDLKTYPCIKCLIKTVCVNACDDLKLFINRN